MNTRPKILDAVILTVFVLLVAWQPYYLTHEIIMMETGIHLPSINALLHGAVPYRDFFFLRGPVELYVPAFFMALWGPQTWILPAFYYVGTLLTLIFLTFLVWGLVRTRYIFYLMIPVILARTFPRISYYYWGGLRYAWGFLALGLLLLFFKKERRRWIFACGIVSAFSLLTTIEAGVSVIVSVLAALFFAIFFKTLDIKAFKQALKFYFLGLAVVVIPYALYLILTHSWWPFWESIYMVVRSNEVFPGAPGVRPETFGQFLKALLPGSWHFKYLTPFYFYVIWLGYFIWRVKNQKLEWRDNVLVGLTVYGLVLYMAAWRKIEGHHFEMALQVEKILYFFLLEEIYLPWQGRKTLFSKRAAGFVTFVFIMLFVSSVGYAFQRYSHRFTGFKYFLNKIAGKEKDLSLLKDEPKRALKIERGAKMIAPEWQADEIEGVTAFLKENTRPDEAIFCYPEVGNFAFWADRPFVGRFPIATFSWMDESWHQELLRDFKTAEPRYVIMTNLGHRTFPSVWYFRYLPNIERFNAVTNFILKNYEPVKTFESVSIYRLKTK